MTSWFILPGQNCFSSFFCFPCLPLVYYSGPFVLQFLTERLQDQISCCLAVSPVYCVVSFLSILTLPICSYEVGIILSPVYR